MPTKSIKRVEPKNQNGFTALFLVIIVSAVVAGLGLVAWPYIKSSNVLGISSTGTLKTPYVELNTYMSEDTEDVSNYQKYSVFKVGEPVRIRVQQKKPVGSMASTTKVFVKKFQGIGVNPSCSETSAGWQRIYSSTPDSSEITDNTVMWNTTGFTPGSYYIMANVNAKSSNGKNISCTGNPAGVCNTSGFVGSCSQNSYQVVELISPETSIGRPNIEIEEQNEHEGSLYGLGFTVTNTSSVDMRNAKVFVSGMGSTISLNKNETARWNETVREYNEWECYSDGVCSISVPYIAKGATYQVKLALTRNPASHNPVEIDFGVYSLEQPFLASVKDTVLD